MMFVCLSTDLKNSRQASLPLNIKSCETIFILHFFLRVGVLGSLERAAFCTKSNLCCDIPQTFFHMTSLASFWKLHEIKFAAEIKTGFVYQDAGILGFRARPFMLRAPTNRACFDEAVTGTVA